MGKKIDHKRVKNDENWLKNMKTSRKIEENLSKIQKKRTLKIIEN